MVGPAGGTSSTPLEQELKSEFVKWSRTMEEDQKQLNYCQEMIRNGHANLFQPGELARLTVKVQQDEEWVRKYSGWLVSEQAKNNVNWDPA